MLGITKAQPENKNQATLSEMPKQIIHQNKERSNHEKTGNEESKRPQSIHTDSKRSEKNQCQTKNITRGYQTMTNNKQPLILRLYALKDELNGFAPPIPFNNDDIAKRYFKEMCAENITVKYSPIDFSIWHIGEYNTATGTLTTGNAPTLIMRGEVKG